MALGLRLGDPDDEVLGAWLAKEYLRDVYLTDDPNEAAVLLDRVIAGCLTDEVDEIVSLGNTLKRWRTQILAHHLTGASNGPTEAMNLLVKKIKRCGHGFKSFRNYRLRVLLHCGGIKWGGCCMNQDPCIFMRQWFQAAYLTRACVTGTHEHTFPKGSCNSLWDAHPATTMRAHSPQLVA
jgi:hypothetical protein